MLEVLTVLLVYLTGMIAYIYCSILIRNLLLKCRKDSSRGYANDKEFRDITIFGSFFWPILSFMAIVLLFPVAAGLAVSKIYDVLNSKRLRSSNGRAEV